MSILQTHPRGLSVRETTSGIPGAQRVVFVHGAMDTGSSFSRLLAHLGDVDAVVYDRRGYGESKLGGRAPFLIEEHVQDLLTLLEGHRSMVLAHSLGGVIALAAAQRSPHLFAGLLTYEAPMPWAPWWPALSLPRDPGNTEQVREAATLFLRRHLSDERWAALDDEHREALLVHGPAWAAELSDARSGPPAFAPEDICVPLLAVHGTLTDERHREATALLAQRAPEARLATIEGAGHLGHRRHSEALAALLREHLAATAEAKA
ncbi:alpha/beta fold hydrolase [Sinomonas sp. P10A9]|uniref:Alpha/beta fold hydrolase n=1 Tax=Sinomonas puerhi TaxID=3238584 RepID=A0AB39L5R6_9MICC